MIPISARSRFHIDPLPFEALELCSDDAVPNGMTLLLAYPGRLDPYRFSNAIAAALETFPHLTGRLDLSLEPFHARIVPSEQDVPFEWSQEEDGELFELPFLPQEILLARFAPSASSISSFLMAPFLAIKLSWLRNGGSVVGILASHFALDGGGLALFLHHLSVALVGGVPPAVVHHRRWTMVDAPSKPDLPNRYRAFTPGELLASSTMLPQGVDNPTIFSVSTSNRLDLASRLCRWTAQCNPEFNEIALWCNVRGLGVPRNYTGNAGCYLQFPIDAQLGSALRGAATRRGFAETAEAYRQIKAHEANGELILWDGPGNQILSLNLVSLGQTPPDFGCGTAVYAQLLSRNVSGIRLYGSASGVDVVVECSLPESVGEHLFQACKDDGYAPRLWHCG